MMTAQHILVVDDDPTLTKHLVRSFATRGYSAVGANDYESAMECVAERAPDYAVLDLMLGRDSGLDLVRDVMRAAPAAHVVVLTGYGSIATAVRAIRLGAKDYLSKPANAEDLLRSFHHPTTAEATNTEPEVNRPTLAEAEWDHIQRVLADCSGNITHAAQRLGLHRRSLQRKLNRGRG
jgi:two-component system response regulator RegA